LVTFALSNGHKEPKESRKLDKTQRATSGSLSRLHLYHIEHEAKNFEVYD